MPQTPETYTVVLHGPGDFVQPLELPDEAGECGVLKFRGEYYRYSGNFGDFQHVKVYEVPALPPEEVYPALFEAIFDMKVANGNLHRDTNEQRVRDRITADFDKLGIEDSYLISADIFISQLDADDLATFVDSERCKVLELCSKHEFGWVADWVMNCHFDGEVSDALEHKAANEVALQDCRVQAFLHPEDK